MIFTTPLTTLKGRKPITGANLQLVPTRIIFLLAQADTCAIFRNITPSFSLMSNIY